jgi:hypothetical protein
LHGIVPNDNEVKSCALQRAGYDDLAIQDPSLLLEVVPLLEHLTETGSPAMRSRGKKLLRLLEIAK